MNLAFAKSFFLRMAASTSLILAATVMLTGCSTGVLTRRGVTSGETAVTPTTVIAAQPESLLPAPIAWVAPTNHPDYVYPQREAFRTNSPAIIFHVKPKFTYVRKPGWTNDVNKIMPPIP